MTSLRSRAPVSHLGLPPVIPDLGWFDATDLSTITASAGAVSTWHDKSGQGNHLTAAGGARPTTGAATIGGLNSLVFGSGSVMSVVPASWTQYPTYFVVLQLTVVPSSDLPIISDQGSPFAQGLFGFHTGEWSCGNGSQVIGGVADLNPHLLSCVFGQGNASLDLDGGNLATGNTGGGGPASHLTVGDGIQAHISELLLFSTSLAAGTRAAMHSYAHTKFATP